MLSKEMQEKLMGEIKRSDKFIELIGIKIIEADEGYCKAELEVDDRHLNPLGTVHGGCLYTLADTVAGFAAASCGFEGSDTFRQYVFSQTDNGCEEADM